MKIQTRLSLFSSIIFGVIFIIIALLTYGLYYKNAKAIIYKNLEKASGIVALFYLEEDELNKEEFAAIREQFNDYAANSDYQVYNERNKIDYGSLSPVNETIIHEIRERKNLAFSDDKFFCYGIFYEDNQGDFVVVTKEQKSTLDEQMKRLLWILSACFFTGLIVLVLLSKWGARRAYRPFSHIIDQVRNISTNNLDVRIQSPNTKDELQNLTDTFNELLAKIAETVVIQRNFANYVSHEFKTPLASMLGNLEVFSIKDRTPGEYRQLAENLIAQVAQLENILNTLMVVSDLRKDTGAGQTRMDELLWEIIDKMRDLHPLSKIQPQIDITPEDEPLLFVPFERTQLLLALFNLIENGVKYSLGKAVNIHIFKQNNRLCLTVTDQGIGIKPGDLANISKPFYRADHTNQIQGSGIGLSIALRILEKNKIEYKISSEVNTGTQVFLKL